jgi:hypothetical protein
MLTFQVVAVQDRSGAGKKGPYRLREVSGVLSLPDGRVQVGSLTFFERADAPLPTVEVGKRYEVVVDVFVGREAKIEARVSGLRPAVVKSAAAL